MTGTTDDEACPYCGETRGVQPMPAPPKVRAWSCVCGTEWAYTTVQPYFDRLAVTVEQLGVLRQVIALADDAPGLTDRELRARLLTLVTRT